jgi:heme-degrading monooxygenase HmoA
MYARTSTWSGSPDAIQKWAENANDRVRSFVESLPGNAGAMFFVDHEEGTALTLTLWESEDAAIASDAHADQSRDTTMAATGTELVKRGRYQVIAPA